MPVPSTSHSRPESETLGSRSAGASGSAVSQRSTESQAAFLAGEPRSSGTTPAETGARIKDAARSTAEDLSRTGRDFLSDQKTKAAEHLSSLGDAIHSAAQQLRQDGNASTAQYADMAARQLDGWARRLGDQDFGSLAGEIERMARRRPEVFLGGMFLIGLGVSRFLKASHPDRPAR
ncbi:MAG: hypothetical protein IT424_10230 [Pirellulales bacterium]|nr:hypothetical protein [Pirellulales bacterium]